MSIQRPSPYWPCPWSQHGPHIQCLVNHHHKDCWKTRASDVSMPCLSLSTASPSSHRLGPSPPLSSVVNHARQRAGRMWSTQTVMYNTLVPFKLTPHLLEGRRVFLGLTSISSYSSNQSPIDPASLRSWVLNVVTGLDVGDYSCCLGGCKRC